MNKRTINILKVCVIGVIALGCLDFIFITLNGDNVNIKKQAYSEYGDKTKMEFTVEFIKEEKEWRICYGLLSKGSIRVGDTLRLIKPDNTMSQAVYKCGQIYGFTQTMKMANYPEDRNIGVAIVDSINAVNVNDRMIIE